MTTQQIVSSIALVLVLLGFLAAIIRAATGPTRADRIVAAELGFVSAVSAILLIAILLDEPILFDFALVAVLIGFLTTIGLARLVPRTRDREDEGQGAS
jgi:multicomponent Na+:H+ antiporter subunit F